jgi:hypothetical protein
VGESESEEQGEWGSCSSAANCEEIELSELFVGEEEGGAARERVEHEQQCVAVDLSLFVERRLRAWAGGEGRYGAAMAVRLGLVERVVKCGIIDVQLGVAG